MTSYTKTTVVVAFLAAFTLLINLNSSAFAGTGGATTTVAPPVQVEKTATTSAKAVVVTAPPVAAKESEKKFTLLGWLCEKHRGKSCECKPPEASAPTVVSAPSPKSVTKLQEQSPPAPHVTKQVTVLPPKPEPVPSAVEIAAAPKADHVVTKTAFESAMVMLTKLTEQGVIHDQKQDARLDKLEQRMVEVPCLIKEAVDEVVVRLENVETKVVRLEQDVGAVGVRLANVETQVVRFEKDVTTMSVRLENVETKVVRLETDHTASVKLTTTSAASSASASSTATSSPVQPPTIIVVPMPAMNTLPTTISGSSCPISICSQSRTSTSAVRLAPTPPRLRPSPPMVAPVSASASYAGGCRPGVFTRLGNWLFGNGNCGVVAPPVIQVPQMSRICAPQQNYCPPSSGCYSQRQSMPRGFGWQQPCPQPVQYVQRPRPQQNCYNGGGYQRGGGGPNVVVTNDINNNNNNNNLIALLNGRR